MSDLQQRIDVVEIELPQLEDLCRIGMQDGEIDVVQRGAKDQVLFAMLAVLPVRKTMVVSLTVMYLCT